MDPTPGQPNLRRPRLRTLVGLSYVAAATNFAINHLPWRYIDHSILLPLNASAGIVGSASFVALVVLVAASFRWYGRRASWVLLGAPFALATFLAVLAYVILAPIYDHP